MSMKVVLRGMWRHLLWGVMTLMAGVGRDGAVLRRKAEFYRNTLWHSSTRGGSGKRERLFLVNNSTSPDLFGSIFSRGHKMIDSGQVQHEWDHSGNTGNITLFCLIIKERLHLRSS